MIPSFIVQIWLLAIVSIGLIASAAYLAHRWLERSWSWEPTVSESLFAPDLSSAEGVSLLAAAIIILLVILAGRPLVMALMKLRSRTSAETGTDPRINPGVCSRRELLRPDGSFIQVSFFGPPDATPLVLTHGWGLHGREWNDLIRDLSGRFRLITWDEPGLGKSIRPDNRDFSLENLAATLKAVLAVTGDKPAILVGHSIGGMIILTFCRLFPELLEKRVAGLVLTHTTPLNPVRTTSGSAFLTAIERPVLVPLMYLTIAFSPLLRLFNWLSYFNGSAHLLTKHGSFGGTESWAQIDFVTRFQPRASPAVLARGMLAMMRYCAADILGEIRVPTLVVAGDRDTTTKPGASEQIRAGIAGASLATLTPAKHLGLIEHHKEYARLVEAFAHSALTGLHAEASRPEAGAKPLEPGEILVPIAAL